MGMYIWYAVLALVGIAADVYITIRIRKFKFVQKLAGDKKWLSYAIAAIPAVIFIILEFFYFVPITMIEMYLLGIWLICDLAGYLFRKLTKREPKFYIEAIIAIVIAVVFFTYGYINAHDVQETKINVETNKKISLDENVRAVKAALIADAHIGATFDGDEFGKIVKKIEKANPSLIIIDGDFVDDDTTREDMVKACKAFADVKTKYGTFFVMGNHDSGYFHFRDFSIEDLKSELQKNNVLILEDKTVMCNGDFFLVGRKDRYENRKSIQELTQNIDKNKYFTIVADHQPHDFVNEAKANVDLVLCGHTHGGQLLPMCWFGGLFGTNDLMYGVEKRENTTFFVSSGISGWGLPFKVGAKCEYAIINISMK